MRGSYGRPTPGPGVAPVAPPAVTLGPWLDDTAAPDPVPLPNRGDRRRPRVGDPRLDRRARRRRRLPGEGQRAITTSSRWRRRSRPSRRPSRRSSTSSSFGQELPEPEHLGREDQRQRRRTDEDEPEILFDALHHAREHLTVEQALYTLHLLADNYGSDSDDHEPRQQPRDLDRLRAQPRRRRVRPDLRRLARAVLRLAQEPPAERLGQADRHRPQPQLRLPLGLLRRLIRQPVVDHLSRTVGVLRSRDAGPPGLRQQPGEERDPADPRPRHVPHQRPAHPLAVRLHEDGHPVGHVGRGPQHVRRDGQGDGEPQRLQGRSSRATSTSPTATRSTGCTASTGSSRSPGSSIRRRRRRSGATTTRPTRTSLRRRPATGAPCSTSSTSAAARTRDRQGDDALRRLQRRLRDLPRLGDRPVRHRHGHEWDVGPARSGPDLVAAASRSSSGRPHPAPRRWSPAARPGRARTSTTSTAGRRRSGRSPIKLPSEVGVADVPLLPRPRDDQLDATTRSRCGSRWAAYGRSSSASTAPAMLEPAQVAEGRRRL